MQVTKAERTAASSLRRKIVFSFVPPWLLLLKAINIWTQLLLNEIVTHLNDILIIMYSRKNELFPFYRLATEAQSIWKSHHTSRKIGKKGGRSIPCSCIYAPVSARGQENKTQSCAFSSAMPQSPRKGFAAAKAHVLAAWDSCRHKVCCKSTVHVFLRINDKETNCTAAC